MEIRVIRDAISRDELRAMAKVQFGDLVKAVVDVERGIMAIGGELHSDEEAVLAGLRARLGTSRSHDRRSAMERTPERTRPRSGIRLRRHAGRGRLRQRPGGLGPLFLRLCRRRTGPSLTPPFSAEPARHCLHTQVVDSRSPLIPQTGSIAMRQDYRGKEGSFKTSDCSGGTARVTTASALPAGPITCPQVQAN